jgi:hypothetical protein
MKNLQKIVGQPARQASVRGRRDCKLRGSPANSWIGASVISAKFHPEGKAQCQESRKLRENVGLAQQNSRQLEARQANSAASNRRHEKAARRRLIKQARQYGLEHQNM